MEERRTKRQKQEQAVHPVDVAASRSDEDFIKEYMRPKSDWQTWYHPSTSQYHSLRLSSPDHLGEADLESCFRLVEETSYKDYAPSSVGWHEEAKREEMKSKDLRYLLVEAEEEEGDGEASKEGSDMRKEEYASGKRGKGKLRAFVSMMPTWEQGEAVVYCYEIHVQPYLQGTGLAQLLMSYVTTTAAHIPSVGKVMLTCFTSNARGRRFYEKLGFAVDENASPRERRLRGGKVIKPDYVIMSRTEKGEADGSVVVAVDSGLEGR